VEPSWLRRHWAKLVGLLGVAMLPLGAHAGIAWGTRIEPPHVDLPPATSGHAWARTRAGLREVGLEGTPEAIGAAHTRLLGVAMNDVERQLWGDFAHYVPLRAARAGIEDWARVRYRHVDSSIPEPRRRELAAEALSFVPDPFADHLPTYHRMLFLHALYDIALSLEHSPLIGCTSFAIDPSRTVDGHVLVGRAFDFEAGDVFDREKVVFLVREDGGIPFASVAWPGLIGVVTGMNAAGVFIAVHGARAGEPTNEGIPVVFAAREALAHAHDTREAVAILRGQAVMVSHLVFVADGSGRFARVERAPGVEAYVREGSATGAVTNHFEGPLGTDPMNLRVMGTTSTLARRARADELLAALALRSARPETALAILRDHKCPGDDRCRVGDRRAIDAAIATHGVIADPTAGVLWVSAGPHLSGHFVRLDLRAMLSPSYDPATDTEPEVLPEDTPVGTFPGDTP
jgi:isopenicillin-N N-acyltransferase-like protein